MSRILLVIATALALSACGFHLRNAISLPADLGPVKVVSRDPYSGLAQSLSQALQRVGIAGDGSPAIVEAPPKTTQAGEGDAPDAGLPARQGLATLNILSERWRDTPISVDQFGRAQEFSLRYAVVFDLRHGDREVVPRQAVELSRDYIAPAVDLTGAGSEREILVREMRRDMVAAVLRRIDAVANAPSPAPSETTDLP